MPRPATRPLDPADHERIAETFRELHAHFHEWSQNYQRQEHDLIAFAYYEGCGNTTCCSDILSRAAPLALGQKLVAENGFAWIMVRAENVWHYAIVHLEVGLFIDLEALETPPHGDYRTYSRGQRTHNAYDAIVEQLNQTRLKI
ncbi:MAG: hypothetical protein K0Q55_883 [Verrucomicrobia bacterium]|jgi:hypothetical protein|nr:hypothetical protein [Verrucomicrobiota bacterium]